MLHAKLLDDVGPRGHSIAQHLPANGLLELVENLFGESARIRGKRLLQENASHLPMPCRGILAFGQLTHPPKAPIRMTHRTNTSEAADVSQPEHLQIGQRQPPDRLRHMRQRVAPYIPILRRIG